MGTIPLPARFGKYQLDAYLGGGMSHVYRATDTVIGRTVVVKILTDAGCADKDAKARFLAEARMAGNISHDNVLSIYDFGTDPAGRPFMVMEYLRGQDLRQAIDQSATGDLKRKLQIALQSARALEYVHSLKIVHRDIKPENIHINQYGVVKLIDFGIAKAQNQSLTQAGFVLGTPSYMAPEQVRGEPVTEQVDVYSFGLLMYELLTGIKPMKSDSMEGLFYNILHKPLDLEPLNKAGLPAPVTALVTACAAKTPAARPQGFPPVVRALENILASLEQPAAPTTVSPAPLPAAAPHKASFVLVGAAAAVGGLLLAVALYLAIRPARNASPANTLPKTIATSTGPMVLVPAGAFLFGEKKSKVELPSFYIDQFEVNNGTWAEFLKAKGRAAPPEVARADPKLPVVNISILEAREFATWAGKRLPNEREWEKAARGNDGRRFPWGDQADRRRGVFAMSAQQSGALEAVDSHPEGASPWGALNMGGNVWELIEQLTPPGPKALEYFRRAMRPPPAATEPWFMVRGQSYQVPLSENMIWDNVAVPARWKARDIGFRCVQDPR